MPFPFTLDRRRLRTPRVSARPSLRASLALLLGVCAAQPAIATSVVPPEFSELVNESSYIVRAVVKSVTAEERTNAQGYRKIYSRVELEVKEVVAGRPPSPLVLEVLGGRVGDRELAIVGAPKFVVGEESILFVQNNGRQVYPLVRMMHGMYRIEKEPTRGRPQMVRSDGQPLRDVRDVSAPFHGTTAAATGDASTPGLSPEDFIRKIRAAVTKPELLEN
jgi:hypothetical protein